MAETAVSKETLAAVEALARDIARLPFHRIWVDYDAEVDCLYLSFRWPPEINDSEDLDNGVIVDYHDDEVVGFTILNASTQGRSRTKKKAREQA